MSEEAFLELESHRLHYRIDGDAADPSLPWILFCNSLGADLRMWDPQAQALAGRFNVLRYDRRGHGQSGPPPAPYSIDDLGRDALALLDALKIERAHFCGLSIGGLTGQWLGLHAGNRLDKIVLCATAAKIGDAQSWAARIASVKADGLAPLVPATAERWFTPKFNAEHPGATTPILETFAKIDPEGYMGCCAALAEADLRPEIGAIGNPVLGISGDDDAVCPPADLQDIADRVQNGRHVSLAGRHLVNVESAQAFNGALLDFLKD